MGTVHAADHSLFNDLFNDLLSTDSLTFKNFTRMGFPAFEDLVLRLESSNKTLCWEDVPLLYIESGCA